MSYDLYDDPQYRENLRKQNKATERQLEWWIAFIFVPIRFIATNLPAVFPAWIGTYYASGIIFSLSDTFLVRAFLMITCFAGLTFAVWHLIVLIHDWAMDEQGILKNCVLVLGGLYIGASYGIPAGAIADAFGEGDPWITGIAGVMSALAGMGFYYDKIRKDVTAGLSLNKLNEATDNLDKDDDGKSLY